MISDFKTCNSCQKSWPSREALLSDPEIELIGYQGSLAGPEEGFYLMNHTRAGCLSTLAIKVVEFSDLYDGPLLEKHRQGAEPCRSHCFYKDNLTDRPEACECRYVRTIMQRLSSWPKDNR